MSDPNEILSTGVSAFQSDIPLISDIIQEKTNTTEREITGSFDGKPFRGPPVMLKSTDNVEEKLKLNQRMHVRTFDLWDTEQLAAYEAVCQDINDGKCMQSVEEIKWVDSRAGWKVLLRYIETWYEAAKSEK